MSNHEESDTTRTNILPLPQYNFWLNAIKNDDSQKMRRVLETCDKLTRLKLLNGSFEFPEIQTVRRLTTKLRTFTHPFTLAAVYGSMGVCDVMLRYDVDVFLQEKRESNVFHCLVCIAFLQPQREESIARSYVTLCSIIPEEHVATLLRMEDEMGFRPLEFAVNQGTLRMMMAIFETPEIYKIREDIIGVRRYRWYDITEYETEDISCHRDCLKSPTNLVCSLEERHVYSDFGRYVFNDSVIGDWIKRSVQGKRLVIICYFFFKILYSCAFFVYQLSQASLRHGSRNTHSSDELHENETDYINNSTVCDNSYLHISLTTQRCLEVYLILQSLVTVLHDALMAVYLFKAFNLVNQMIFDLLGQRKKMAFDMTSAYQRTAALLFAILVLVEIAIYNNPTKENLSYLVVAHVLQTPIITTSILHHMAIFRSIGHMIFYIRRMVSMLFTFIIVFGGFLLMFVRLFIMMSETESIGECTSQFSGFFTGVYSSLLLFFNSFDVQSLRIGFVVGFETVHVCFVFILGILLYNLLIALFSDEVNLVSENRGALLSIDQLFSVLTLDYLGLNTPIVRSIYIPLKRAWIMKNFVSLDGRICLCFVDSAKMADNARF